MGERMTEKMTIAEGLKELKRIDSLLTQRFALIMRYCSKKKNSRDEIEKQQEYVKEQTQSAIDLLKRYSTIKLAIQQANLSASFTFGEKQYTLAEAILYKQYLYERYGLLWNSFTNNNAQMQLQYAQTRQYANLTPEQLEKIDMIPELYYDEKHVQQQKEELMALKLNMDSLIDKTNHATTIEV
jgi:hypothetical protein